MARPTARALQLRQEATNAAKTLQLMFHQENLKHFPGGQPDYDWYFKYTDLDGLIADGMLWAMGVVLWHRVRADCLACSAGTYKTIFRHDVCRVNCETLYDIYWHDLVKWTEQEDLAHHIANSENFDEARLDAIFTNRGLKFPDRYFWSREWRRARIQDPDLKPYWLQKMCCHFHAHFGRRRRLCDTYLDTEALVPFDTEVDTLLDIYTPRRQPRRAMRQGRRRSQHTAALIPTPIPPPPHSPHSPLPHRLRRTVSTDSAGATSSLADDDDRPTVAAATAVRDRGPPPRPDLQRGVDQLSRARAPPPHYCLLRDPASGSSSQSTVSTASQTTISDDDDSSADGGHGHMDWQTDI